MISRQRTVLIKSGGYNASMIDCTKIQLAQRHQISAWAVAAPSAHKPFADYVTQTRERLAQAHAGQNEAAKIVEGNAPFELTPSDAFATGRDKPFKRGVLLVHGLTDSPYHMRYLADFFQRNGFRVMAILLPGHGTQAGDLLEVKWQAWAATVAYGVACLAQEVDEVYLAGFSAGAALCVRHAAQDTRVRGLFLFSPALEITPRAKWAKWHWLYSWLTRRAAWLSVLRDADCFKYESFCKNAAAQMYALTQSLPREALAMPIFTAASADDATVNSAATWRFMQRATHAANQLVWYAKQAVTGEKVVWVNSVLPEHHIVSSAHTAVVIPPQDAHYGVAGAYVNCLHYCAHDAAQAARCCSGKERVLLGEISEAHLHNELLRRLTFNPHFAQLENAMRQFIERLP